jgi:type II secretory pathway component PulM
MAASPLTRVTEAAERQIELLSPRDRRLLMGLVGFGALLGLAVLWWSLDGMLDDKASRVRLAKENLSIATQMQADFKVASAKLGDQETRLKEYTNQPISAKIEEIASNRGVLESLRSVNENSTEIVGKMKQTKYSIDFKAMPIESAMGLLYDLETDPYPVSVEMADFKVTTNREGKKMSMTLELVVFMLAEG